MQVCSSKSVALKPWPICMLCLTSTCLPAWLLPAQTVLVRPWDKFRVEPLVSCPEMKARWPNYAYKQYLEGLLSPACVDEDFTSLDIIVAQRRSLTQRNP